MNFDKVLSLMKEFNNASQQVAKNEGVLLRVVDNIQTNNNPTNSSTEPVKKVQMRCCIESCKKKLSLSNKFTCKCDKDKIYCSAHRMPEDHACTAPIEKIKLDKVTADPMRGGRV